MSREEENREKEITQAAEANYFVTKEEEFAWIHGAEWADQHPRKGLWDAQKVIEWLIEYTDDYIVRDTDDSWLREDDFIRDLQKAMKD